MTRQTSARDARRNPTYARPGHPEDMRFEDTHVAKRVTFLTALWWIAGGVIGALVGLALAALVDASPAMLGLGAMAGFLTGVTAAGLVGGRISATDETAREERWPER